MTYPRAHLVDAENGGRYHVFTRCVQQQWLCGTDPETGRCYEHRKQWVEDRLIHLVSIFSVDLYAYAVMSNHYHAVVDVDVARSRQWTNEEVARRWCRLLPKRSELEIEREVQRLLLDTARIEVLRERLGNLSWFMRYLNEYIARRANRESGTKGRFWQGRFESKHLLDETALLGCMVYVDLNPVRAGIANRPEGAPHTSIRRRIRQRRNRASPLVSLSYLGLSLADYLALVRWSASVARGKGSGRPKHAAAKALVRLGLDSDSWLNRVQAHKFKYRAYGALQLLRAHAQYLGQRWLKGAKPGFAAPA